MGSLNADGSRITQDRKAVKNIGGSYIFSSDGREVESILATSAELGTGANLLTSQFTTINGGEQIKVNSSLEDSLIARVIATGVADTSDGSAPPFFGSGGGGGDFTGLVPGDLIFTNVGVNRVYNSGTLSFEILNDGIFNVNAPIATFGLSNYMQVEASTGIYLETGDFSVTSSTLYLEGNGKYIQLDSTKVSLGSVVEIDGTLNVTSDVDIAGKLNWTSLNGSQIVEDANGALDIQAGATEENIILNQNTIVSSNGIYVNGIVNGRRDVEVITMASGNSVTLAAASGQVIIVNGTGPRTVNLTGSPSIGLIYDVKDGNGTASSGNVTVQGNGANIDGESSFAIDVNYASYTFVYNGTEWNLI